MEQDSTREIWSLSLCKELGTLYKGYKGLVEGTTTFLRMSHDEIRDIPPDKSVIYARIVVDYWPQKADPNRVRCLTVCGNLLNEPGEFSTTTADLTTSKTLWNNVFSKKHASFHPSISKLYTSKLQ